jgi:hypothetical protein
VHFKKAGRCKLHWPFWLNPENIETLIEEEKNEGSFSSLDFHHAEMAKIILDVFGDELVDARGRTDPGRKERISALLADLQNIRKDRLIIGLNGESMMDVSDLQIRSALWCIPLFASINTVCNRRATTL